MIPEHGSRLAVVKHSTEMWLPKAFELEYCQSQATCLNGLGVKPHFS